MDIRIKRLIAFVIDWNITLFPFVLLITVLTTFLQKEDQLNPTIALLCFLMVIFSFGAFIFRDVIFKGHSLGKRIFGLSVYEKGTLKQASSKQCLFRNVFFFLLFIDGILLLVTGQTIGDRVAGTFVTSKQGLALYAKEVQFGAPAKQQEKVKKIVLVIAIIVLCFALFVGLIKIVLNSQKDSEEYKVAYSYLVESRAFKELNVDESKISFNQYSLQTHTANGDSSASKTVRIGFVVNFKSFEIVCHKENGVWKVCDECTLFE